jgi:hypothetical protein
MVIFALDDRLIVLPSKSGVRENDRLFRDFRFFSNFLFPLPQAEKKKI